MMDSAPSTEAVYQGVYTLYNNSNTVEQEKASKWLEQLQNSVYSWQIANDLLQQKRDIHSCYFAAQTIRNKIQNSFDELPNDAHIALRDSLITHISQITIDTNTIIVTQLCLALADLALLMGQWNNPVNDLVGQLAGNENSLWPLINTITLIPEEIDSRNLRLGSNRRDEILAQLRGNSRLVCDLLVGSLKNYTHDNPVKVLYIIKCFTSWICAHAIDITDAANEHIVGQSLIILNDTATDMKLHDAATDLLCSFLQRLETINNEVLEAQMLENVAKLNDAYNMAVAHEDVDRTMNYCRIFSQLTESFLDKIIKAEPYHQPHYAIKSLDLVLNCIGHYDYEVAELTFSLWYRLSEEVYQKNCDELTRHFQPFIERLLSSLYRLAQMEPDQEGLLDDTDNFSDFRHKVSDVIKDVVFIVGSSNCFKQMFSLLQQPNNTWESSESALFVMSNIARNIIPEENEIVPKVVEAILKLPDYNNTHIAFRYTSIMLLGELCEWIDCHPETLESVLNFLVYSLNEANGLAQAAATALTQICTSCKSRLTGQLTGLLSIARSLDTYKINNESVINLLKGISVIVGRLPIDQLGVALKEMCSFQLIPLQLLLSTDNAPDKTQHKNDPCFWLDRWAAVIRYTNPDVGQTEEHPCMVALCDAWPLISEALNKYQGDAKVMERACRCIRYAMRAIGKRAAPLLEQLVKQIVELYATHHHSCFLYLGSILVDEFGNASDQCNQGLLSMMQAFIDPTFNVLQMDNGLKNNPDTVDDFFRLCSRFLQRCPIPFLESHIVTPIIQCALLACTLDHKDANLSVMKFFYSLLSCGRTQHHHNNSRANNTNDLAQNASNVQKQQLVHQIVQRHGESLVINLIQASVYYLHSYMLSDVADVLFEMIHINAEQLSNNLRVALNTLPKKNSGGCITATNKQLDDFHAAIIRSEASKAMTHALKEFTRLYR